MHVLHFQTHIFFQPTRDMSDKLQAQAMPDSRSLSEKRPADEEAVGVSQSESDNDVSQNIVKDWDGEEAAVKRKYVEP
jgi:hypothetical protein